MRVQTRPELWGSCSISLMWPTRKETHTSSDAETSPLQIFGRLTISESSPRDNPGVGSPVGQIGVSEIEQEPHSSGRV
jgi:hypothetical protein